MATFTGIVGIGYHLLVQLAHLKADITTGDDHHAPNTPAINMMTGEAIADLILDLTPGTSVSHPRHHSTDRHASRERMPRQRHTPNSN